MNEDDFQSTARNYNTEWMMEELHCLDDMSLSHLVYDKTTICSAMKINQSKIILISQRESSMDSLIVLSFQHPYYTLSLLAYFVRLFELTAHFPHFLLY